jgi:adenylate cyclase
MERKEPRVAAVREQIVGNQAIIDELNARLARKTEEVRIIQQISSGVLGTLDLQAILERILETMDSLLGFSHAVILLSDEAGQTLKVAAARGYPQGSLGAVVPVGIGPLGMVAKKQRIVRLSNIQAQLGYHAAVRARLEADGQGPRADASGPLPGLPDAESQIGIPLVVKDRLVGVFAVESQSPNAFDEVDEVLLTIVGNQVANAILNARLHEAELARAGELKQFNAELSRLNETLEASVTERTRELTSVLESVKREQVVSSKLLARTAPAEVIPDLLAGRLQARRIAISVLFTDLQNFTSYSSGLEPDEIFSQLNELFGWAGEVIQRYRGYVNKTIGDSVMALFGVPNGSPTHALDSVLAALAMQRELHQKFSLPMRIGINSGPVTAGMLGSHDKSLYDVLGDTVNVASRMEHYSEAGAVSISEQTYNLVAPYFEIQSMGEHDVKGKGRMNRYRVVGIKDLATDARRIDPSSLFARDFRGVIDEVYDFRRRLFLMVDFVSLQARDGSLSHSEAVASFALVLLRYLLSQESLASDPALGLRSIDPERLLRIALLHDLGKHALSGSELNEPCPDSAQKDRLRGALLQHTLAAVERLGMTDLAPDIEDLYRFESCVDCAQPVRPLIELVAIADIYDALTAPKLYKGKSWRITGALEELLRLPYCRPGSRPFFTAFVEMMKPEASRIAVRSADKVLFW